jgi:hypothetical protein
VSDRVPLNALTEPQKDALLLTTFSLLHRLLAAVREHTEPGWKVRREVEKLVEEAADQRPFRLALERSYSRTFEESRTARNAARWGDWER